MQVQREEAVSFMPRPAGYHYSYSDSVAPPMPSVPNVIGSQYQPGSNQPLHGSAAFFPAPAPEAGVYSQQPSSAAIFNAHGYNSNPHASVYQPGAPLYAQPGAATDFFSASGGNTNDDPYTSTGLVARPANNQGANVWASWLLDAVRLANKAELEAIVDCMIRNQYHHGLPLMEVAESSIGAKTLKELVRRVGRMIPGALWRLFKCLIDGWEMEQSNGSKLLQHFYDKLDYVHCSIFIDELARPRFWEMVTSKIGSKSMWTCLENARYIGQGAALLNEVVFHTVQIASSNKYGSKLLRAVLHRGSNICLKERIRERVEDNLAELSMDQFGNFVVQACFLPFNGAPPDLPGNLVVSVILLQRGLRAFLRLPDERLRELVQNNCARRYVLRRLLDANVDWVAVAPAEAVRLARRIFLHGAAGDDLKLAWRVICSAESERATMS